MITARSESPDLCGVKALVAAPDALTRRLLRERLSRWGARVTDVADGHKALVEIRFASDQEKPFRLLVLSARMPEGDGFWLAERLREEGHAIDGLILVFDAGRQSDDLLRARDLGIGAHVAAPVDRIRLSAAVLTALGRGCAASGTTVPGRPRVLLVEDSPDTAALVRGFLSTAGIETDHAENGRTAIGLHRMFEYDLVLMDIQMPELDGYEAAGAIRAWERERRLPRSRVVAMTAFTRTETAQKSMRSGFDAYLPKPLAKEALLSLVTRMTGNRTEKDVPELRLAALPAG